MKRIKGLVFAAWAVSVCTDHAGSAQGQAAAYLKFGVDARILGMGGAGTASSRDVYSGYWNPAGLSQMTFREFGAQHTTLSLDRDYNYFAVGGPVRKGGWNWGFSYHRFSVDGIPETRIYDGTRGVAKIDVDGNGRFDDPVLTNDAVAGVVVTNPNRATDSVKIFSYFEDSESMFSFSGAKKLSDKLGVGASLKFFNQDLFTESADGVGADLGLQYQYNQRTRFGIAVKDLFSSLKWTTGHRDDLPVTISFGTELKLKGGVLFSADALKRENETMAMRFGAEKWFFERYALRIGNNEGDFTLGASALMQEWSFDYAYNDQDLGSVQRISVKRKF